MATLDLVTISRIQKQLREQEPLEPVPLSSDELQHFWDRGNERRPFRPDYADGTKVNIVRITKRWIDFCNTLKGKPDWKVLLKSLSWENKGLAEAFVRYVIRTSHNRRIGAKINAESTMRVYLRELWQLYGYSKHTSEYLDSRVRVHLLAVARSEITPKFGLRREPETQERYWPPRFHLSCLFPLGSRHNDV